MPRVGREQSGTGIYHVMLRGINRQDIFEEPEDYWTFIRILSAVHERLEDDHVTRTTICHIYAYCLMPNHFNQKPVPLIDHPSEARLGLCASGHMLLVTPWSYQYRHNNQEITVAECKTMNCIAQALCHTKDNWWK